jgi:hypothetical protein
MLVALLQVHAAELQDVDAGARWEVVEACRVLLGERR